MAKKQTSEVVKAKKTSGRRTEQEDCFEWYTSNPTWREIYENAPTPASKAMWKDILSKGGWSVDARALRLEKEFTVEDWQYMLDHWPVNPLRSHFLKGLELAKKK